MSSRKAYSYGSRYTDELPPDISDIVRRISGGEYRKFRTDRLSFDDEGDDARTVVHLRAYQLPGSETWGVSKHTEYIAGGTITRDVSPVAAGMCFFDALYYLAKFQSTEEQLKQSFIDGIDPDVPHYREVGEALGQPFDADTGMPVP